MSGQIADYEMVEAISEDGALPLLRARRPARLGEGNQPITVWALGPVARAPWTTARQRLERAAAVRSQWLPDWLEAGVGEWGQRQTIWVSAATTVVASLASPGIDLAPAGRLRALAGAARGAHALHEHGILHAAICPQAVALVRSAGAVPSGDAAALGGEGTAAVLAPPGLADGAQPLLQVGYPPIGFVDPQLLRGEGGRWSDIWALGAVARYTLVGSPPYPGIEDLPVVQALAQLLAVPAPATAELPAPVSDLVASCMAQDPEARPGTAEEVAHRLEEAAAKW